MIDYHKLRQYAFRWLAIATIGLLVFVAMGLGWQIYQADKEDEKEESLRKIRKMADPTPDA